MKRVPLSLALAAPLLALSACSQSGSPPAPEANLADAPPKAIPADETPLKVAPSPPKAATPPSPATSPAVGARRCGWLHNPTPGNWWLFDRDGEWILASQGGHQAAGMDEMPDMSTAGWVETNGHYGYGCACMTITAAPGSLEVERVEKARPQPLKQCRADRALPRPR